MRPNLQNRFTTKTPGFLASQRHNKNSFIIAQSAVSLRYKIPEPATGIYCVLGMSRGFYLIPHNSLLGLPVGRLGLSDTMQFAQ